MSKRYRDRVTRVFTVATARVAGLLTTTTTTTATETTTLGRTSERPAISGALTGNVADLSTLVALGTTRAAGSAESAAAAESALTTLGGIRVIAVAREVTCREPLVSHCPWRSRERSGRTRLVAPVAGLLLLGASAFTAHVSILCRFPRADVSRSLHRSRFATCLNES